MQTTPKANTAHFVLIIMKRVVIKQVKKYLRTEFRCSNLKKKVLNRQRKEAARLDSLLIIILIKFRLPSYLVTSILSKCGSAVFYTQLNLACWKRKAHVFF